MTRTIAWRFFAAAMAVMMIVALGAALVPVGRAEAICTNPVYVDAARLDDTGDGASWGTAKKYIQSGVNLVCSSGTVNVAVGTYDEQVVISKSLTLQGAGDTTIVKPSSADNLTQVFDGLYFYGGTKQIAGIIVANVSAGGNVTVKSLKVDQSLVTTKPTGADYLTGIFYRETGGTVDTVSIVGGGAWSNGDRAYGIRLSAGTNPVSVEVKGSTVTNFDKEGINATGNTLTVNIHHNTITGRGLISDECQNGVDICRDAVATVNDNTISNLAFNYTPADDSWAGGIVVSHSVSPTGKSATADNNTITNCQMGITFVNANASAQDNTVSGGTVGLVGICAWPDYAGAYTASFVHNTVSGITDGGASALDVNSAIDLETFDDLATLTATISNNTLTSGYGATDGVYVGGSAGSVTAAISGNIISGWPEYGINLANACVAGATITGNTIQNNTGVDSGVYVASGVPLTNVHVNFNSIIGNSGTGVSNLATGTLDAINNWWGANDGPGAVGPGHGDKVSDNVTYDPWLVIGISASPASIAANGTSTSTITADMTKNSDNVTTTGVPNGTQIAFTTTGGTLSKASENTTGGIAVVTLTSSTTPGPVTVSAAAPGDATYGKASTTVTLNAGDEIGVFRPSSRMWYLDLNDNGTWDGSPTDRLLGDFGLINDIPVVGDWNADNVTEIGVFRPTTRMWYLDYNGDGRWMALGTGEDRVKGDFGLIGDKPVVGDWNNDGRDEIGVFRPSSRMWYLDYNNNGKWDGMATTNGNDIWAGPIAIDDRLKGDFGLAGDIPVVGDWNNDGTDEIGVFRPSTRMWYLDYNNDGRWMLHASGEDRVKGDFGKSGDTQVVGDWNGNGTDEIGVFRPSSRMWYLDYNNDGRWNLTSPSDDRAKGDFGFSTDIPVVGKWVTAIK